MTASEKRYFKRHYASEKNLTTDLFDFINGMSEYQEDLVKKHFVSSKLSKNLKVYKVQLTDLLLKSLVSYHNKSSIRSKIRMGLEEVELLLDKQLHVFALNKLKKVKALCLKYEELEYIFSILYFEIFLDSFFNVDLNPSENSIIEELEGYTHTLKRIYELKKINFSLHDKNNNELTSSLTTNEENLYKSFLKNQLAQETPAVTLSEQYYRNSSLAIINKLVFNDSDTEFEFKKKNIKLFEDNPHFIENNAGFYFAAIFNFLICLRRLEQEEELKKWLDTIKALTDKYPFLKRNLIFVYYLETKDNFNKKNYHYLIDELEPEITKHIKKFNQAEEHLTALIFLYLALTYLVLKNYQKVHYYLRRLSAVSKSLGENYSQVFETLELVSNYESKDAQVIQNLLVSIKRKIKSNKKVSPFFTQVIQLFTNLEKADSSKKPVLAEEFLQKAAEYEDDGVYKLLNEFILNDWLLAIQKEISYSEQMQGAVLKK